MTNNIKGVRSLAGVKHSSLRFAKMLLLDRDGIINVNHGYVHEKEHFDFVEGIFDLVKRANQANISVVVVTNQSGIARGMYTEADFASISEWMLSVFTQNDAKIDRIYYCPHHPEAKMSEYRGVCDCRKPSTGMLLQAMDDFAIAASDCIMVGDKRLDVDCAIAANISKVFWMPETTDYDASVAAVAKSTEIERSKLVRAGHQKLNKETQVSVIRSLAQIALPF